MRLFFVLAASSYFGVLLLPSRAQQPAPAAPQGNAAKAATPPTDEGKPPLFTTGSRLVMVDVTVKDKSGNTINGLKTSDFAVTKTAKSRRSRSSNRRC